MNANDEMIETLKSSNVFRAYERSFTDATNLPIAVRPVESWQLPFHRKKRENSFCALMADNSRTCAACLQVQGRLAQSACDGEFVASCAYGLCEFAAPVRQEGKVIGFLQSGQVLQRKPTAKQFNKVSQQARENGVECDEAVLKKAFFETPVLPPEKIQSLARLLSIFAAHLSLKCDQVAVQKANAELPQITKARNYIRDHSAENLSQDAVAKAVNMSAFYFCKMFTKYAGMHFTEFVSHVRTDRARNLLMNKDLAVSEIAYEVGFQSLTHFNRVFKKLVGFSPSQFRLRLPKSP